MLNQSKSNKVWVSDLNRSASRPFSVDGPIRFYDTTLRDGEQTVGVVLQPDQKVSLARHLDSLGVSRIEAGFARVSPEDADAIRRIRDDGLKAEIWGFARAARPDVDEVIRLGMKFTVIEIPTSAIKLNNDFGLATACAIAAVRAGANWIQGTINGMGERAKMQTLQRSPWPSSAFTTSRPRSTSPESAKFRKPCAKPENTNSNPGGRWWERICSSARAAPSPANSICPKRSSPILPSSSERSGRSSWAKKAV